VNSLCRPVFWWGRTISSWTNLWPKFFVRLHRFFLGTAVLGFARCRGPCSCQASCWLSRIFLTFVVLGSGLVPLALHHRRLVRYSLRLRFCCKSHYRQQRLLCCSMRLRNWDVHQKLHIQPLKVAFQVIDSSLVRFPLSWWLSLFWHIHLPFLCLQRICLRVAMCNKIPTLPTRHRFR